MPKVQGYKQVYLNEMMEMLDDGENRAKEILSSFSCPLNPDVEDFYRLCSTGDCTNRFSICIA